MVKNERRDKSTVNTYKKKEKGKYLTTPFSYDSLGKIVVICLGFFFFRDELVLHNIIHAFYFDI